MPLPPVPIDYRLPLDLHSDGSVTVLDVWIDRLDGIIATAIFSDEQLAMLGGWLIHRSAGSDVVEVKSKEWSIEFRYYPMERLWRKKSVRRGRGKVSALQIEGPPNRRNAEKPSRVIEVPEVGDNVIANPTWVRSPLPVDREGTFTLGDRLSGVTFLSNGELHVPPDKVFTQAEAIKNLRLGQYTVNRSGGYRQVLKVASMSNTDDVLYFSFEKDAWYQWRQAEPSLFRNLQNFVSNQVRFFVSPFDPIREMAAKVTWFIDEAANLVFGFYKAIYDAVLYVIVCAVIVALTAAGAVGIVFLLGLAAVALMQILGVP